MPRFEIFHTEVHTNLRPKLNQMFEEIYDAIPGLGGTPPTVIATLPIGPSFPATPANDDPWFLVDNAGANGLYLFKNTSSTWERQI